MDPAPEALRVVRLEARRDLLQELIAGAEHWLALWRERYLDRWNAEVGAIEAELAIPRDQPLVEGADAQ